MTNEAPPKKADKTFLLVALVAFMILAVLYALSLSPQKAPEVASDDSAASPATATAAFDLEKAKAEHILGDEKAPIRITEHASLTCSHCAHFHKESFDAFKKAYIDTGKAYLVFSDFPLNAPAMKASQLARCMPDDKYFDFIHDLFTTQDQWAFNDKYLITLKTKAKEFGLDEATAQACLDSKDLQTAISDKMQAAGEQWSISSTPSFVVNNQIIIAGALPFAEFDKKVQDALAEIQTRTTTGLPQPANTQDSGLAPDSVTGGSAVRHTVITPEPVEPSPATPDSGAESEGR